jgi:hypothetical protein
MKITIYGWSTSAEHRIIRGNLTQISRSALGPAAAG